MSDTPRLQSKRSTVGGILFLFAFALLIAGIMLGVSGWWPAFYLLGVVSVLLSFVAGLVLVNGTDPHNGDQPAR